MFITLDPMVDRTERFAIGRSRNATADTGSRASRVRPFGLRFATPPESVARPDPVQWRLCPDRQIAIRPDGADLLDMTQKTTGPSGDGSSGGGAEEWGPDHHDDDGTPA